MHTVYLHGTKCYTKMSLLNPRERHEDCQKLSV